MGLGEAARAVSPWGTSVTQQRPPEQEEVVLGRSLRKRVSQEVIHGPDGLGAGRGEAGKAVKSCEAVS